MNLALVSRNSFLLALIGYLYIYVFITGCKQPWVRSEKNIHQIYRIDSAGNMLNKLLWEYANISKFQGDTFVVIRSSYPSSDINIMSMQFIVIGTHNQLPFCNQLLFDWAYGPDERQLTIEKCIIKASNNKSGNRMLWEKIRSSCLFYIDTISIGDQQDYVMGFHYLDVTIFINNEKK